MCDNFSTNKTDNNDGKLSVLMEILFLYKFLILLLHKYNISTSKFSGIMEEAEHGQSILWKKETAYANLWVNSFLTAH